MIVLSHWFRDRSARRHPQRRNARPHLLCLEDRLAPAVAYALSGLNLLSFDTASPTVTSSTAITGVSGTETLVGIDFRTHNGMLYGLGVNAAADTATVYAIQHRTGIATAIGPVGSVVPGFDLPDPTTTGYGFD